ncbi:hypothetical protein CQ10_29480 [Bradyrhizobium valentinum]|nr:hypothetical protein CQ10_29480 [Bradyrhizobium valentinum]
MTTVGRTPFTVCFSFALIGLLAAGCARAVTLSSFSVAVAMRMTGFMAARRTDITEQERQIRKGSTATFEVNETANCGGLTGRPIL